ncbi:hypothetical protein HGRIS_005913 [Hohenbuehelia grisea]|uniref:DUF6534 domain-containing protein n=1 Tax=Hohenbuehelia grisea TaxID=104357 RepID=A0ABR3JY87_9AGAR
MSSVAAIEAGTLVSTFLVGACTLQAVAYFSKFPEDRLFVKILAAFLCLVLLGYTIAIAHFHYVFTINSSQGAWDMVYSPVSIDVASIFSTIISAVVQAFLTDRMRRFTKLHHFAKVLWFLIFFNFVRGCFISATSFNHTLADYNHHFRWLAVTGRLLDVVIDIVISATLSWSLFRQRNLAFRRTTRLIDRIIMVTINTGTLASAMAAATTICYLTMPVRFVYVGLYVCTAPVYVNTFFASLNIRTSLRRDVDADHIPSIRFAVSTLPLTVKSPSASSPSESPVMHTVAADREEDYRHNALSMQS